MCVYNTAFNTLGVGDPVPYGMNSFGSGDRFDLGPKFKSGFTSRGRSYSQYNYKPAKMTFKPPRAMKMPGIPHPPKPPRMAPPPPPPRLMALLRMGSMPFLKKSVTTSGTVSGLKPKPLLVMATKKKKKK